ncbi:Pentatricopeptide repeat-containing protein [Ananas comosus]|uniref:Pentatricopeptide repeat-containing protein n=1 Tax=Ananas comosus TaxID=4615 RepID=A0A199VNK0_ANACO|nr:Pentatricopeptide repeat-containing protein [Ananas comosus]
MDFMDSRSQEASKHSGDRCDIRTGGYVDPKSLKLPRSFNGRYKLPFFFLFFSHSSSSTPPFLEGDPNASSSSWTAAIRSAADAGRPRRALHLYICMLRSGPQPCPFALGLRSHVYPHTALADLYSRLPQSSDAARKVLDEVPVRNIVSWNCSLLSPAIRRSPRCPEGVRRNATRDVVSWNSMVAGSPKPVIWIAPSLSSKASGEESRFLEWADLWNGCAREAVRLFNRMRKPDVGVQPNEKTFSCVISACSQLGDLRFGLDLAGANAY